ncbi:MAG TPA: HEAT repeat domain-containing protein [Tepidisphaeraceae bacterium]
MKRAIVLLPILLACWTLRAGAAETAQEEAELAVGHDVYCLLDPHVSSVHKLDACNDLARRGPDARVAMAALIRQSRYDQLEVREAAARALSRLLYPWEWEILVGHRQGDPGSLVAFADDFRRGVTTWEAAPAVEVLLHSPSPELRRIGLAGLINLSLTDDAMAKVSPSMRRDLAGALLQIDSAREDAGTRRRIRLIADRLGPIDPTEVYRPPALAALLDSPALAAPGAPLARVDPRQLQAATRAVMRATCAYVPAIRPIVERLCRNPDPDIRRTAADALGTQEARALAAVANVLADLRSNDPLTRSAAARRLESLGVEPPELTAALVRAVDARDLASREGLILALERSYFDAGDADAGDAVATLRTLAATDADPTQRAYARAALRQLGQPR